MNRVAAALICGLMFRWGTAIVTEYYPLFPPHYYNDAVAFDRNAKTTVSNWRSGKFILPGVSPSSRVYTTYVASLYWAFGAKPLIPKLLNGLAATAAVYCWYRVALLVVSPNAAFLCLCALACWPSFIFFSSQNLKDPHIYLLSSAALLAILTGFAGATRDPPPSSLRNYSWAALGAFLLYATGFYRPYFMVLLIASLLTAILASQGSPAGRRRWKAYAVIGAWVIAPLIFFRPGVNFLYGKVLVAPSQYNTTAARIQIIPITQNPQQPAEIIRPYDPQSITAFRRIRHSQDQWESGASFHRNIETQIFPEQKFESWWDIAAYLPKGAFYALFMPLPGLYPLSGKLGRQLASMENIILLSTFLMGGAFWIRRPSLDVKALALGLFFCAAVLAYGVFEYDLGAAARHRIQYFPCVLIFASAFLYDKMARRRT